jgi:arsenate reductase-like glutaredoxin family protein
MMPALETLLVFVHPDCAASRNLLEDFRRRRVRFTEIDVTTGPEAMERLREWSWESRLPVVVDHERVSIGFRGASTSFDALGL